VKEDSLRILKDREKSKSTDFSRIMSENLKEIEKLESEDKNADELLFNEIADEIEKEMVNKNFEKIFDREKE
jgi:(p)ppGpp synthase/HD superfamily hydrolase